MKKTYNRSLVIGKFYPPHLGHHHLISVAMENSRYVTVLVMGTFYDTLPPKERVRILQEVHGTKDITVIPVIDHIFSDYGNETIWKAHDTIIQNNLPGPIDAVFSSEAYGDELAKRLNAKHVCVDVARKAIPVSATQIRRNLYANWTHLHPETQRRFKLNITVLGGESTGTTTLASDLQKHFWSLGGSFSDTALVPEYGREYAEKRIEVEGTRHLVWSKQDFDHIARVQNDLQQEAWRSTVSPIQINDTDSVATEAFADYYGVERSNYSRWAMASDLYFVTDHENMPLEDDGSRLQDIDARNKSTQTFIDTIIKRWDNKAPYVLISGDRETRRNTAIRIVRRLLEMEAMFSDPI